MKRITLFLFALTLSFSCFAQESISDDNHIQNSAERLLSQDSRLKIGGYGEVHYNQPLKNGTRQNGMLDVHRLVLLFGYDFTNRLSFISELEFEHVKEVYVEQAFLQYRVNNFLNVRAGLLLVPMGIINEYHEPVTFNGVERPLIDKYIAPTTWREVGIGITGNVLPARMRYQLYVVNGFNGYDGTPRLDGKNGLRKGRQKGAESFVSSPNVTGKIEYYGVRGLNLGISGYAGKTQSTLYDGVSTSEGNNISVADSSVAGIAMIGLDARYSIRGLQLRGQYYYTSLSNTLQYNYFTGTNDEPNNLGSSMLGYYVEAGYNVLGLIDQAKTALIPFVRYEQYNTQHSVEKGIYRDESNNQHNITTGLTWKLDKGAVIKADIQFMKAENETDYNKVFNAGFGIMF